MHARDMPRHREGVLDLRTSGKERHKVSKRPWSCLLDCQCPFASKKSSTSLIGCRSCSNRSSLPKRWTRSIEIQMKCIKSHCRDNLFHRPWASWRNKSVDVVMHLVKQRPASYGFGIGVFAAQLSRLCMFCSHVSGASEATRDENSGTWGGKG